MDSPSKIINNRFPSLRSNTSFTLIELLVVIGILAILTAAVIIILNPAEYLKQTRDVTRMNDLTSINQALSVLESQGITNFGLANTVYVSIPDTTSTCANLGLPTLPSNYSYHCVSTPPFKAPMEQVGFLLTLPNLPLFLSPLYPQTLSIPPLPMNIILMLPEEVGSCLLNLNHPNIKPKKVPMLRILLALTLTQLLLFRDWWGGGR